MGNMKFHVASRGGGGGTINFASQQGGGVMFKLFQKIIKKFTRSLRSLDFYKLNCYKYKGRPLNFSFFTSAKSILFCWFYCLVTTFIMLGFDKKLID